MISLRFGEYPKSDAYGDGISQYFVPYDKPKLLFYFNDKEITERELLVASDEQFKKIHTAVMKNLCNTKNKDTFYFYNYLSNISLMRRLNSLENYEKQKILLNHFDKNITNQILTCQ